MFDDLREDLHGDSDGYLEMFKKACHAQDPYLLEEVMNQGFLNNWFDRKEILNNIVTDLCDLLLQNWHHSHEDIVVILEDGQPCLEDEQSSEIIEALYLTIQKGYQKREQYGDYDKELAYILARKCIWALGKSKRPKSREKLILLTKSNDLIIKEEAAFVLSQYF